MRLIRFGEPGKEKPGICTPDGRWLDCSAFGEDWNESFFGTDGISRLRSWLEKNQKSCPHVSPDTRLGPPVARPSKIICVGLNYILHAKETGLEVPNQPVLFMKASSSLTGPNDDIIIPKNSTKTDWEVELGIVVEKRALYVEEKDALNYVAGYVLHNDVSEREFQLNHGGQWVKGKSCDTFAPLGPWLVTPDEIPDPHKLRLWLTVNGERMQDSNTSDMAHGIPKMVSYISQYMSLLPGDLISTGTPSGVGMGLKPPRYLKDGDIVELGIDGLGTARQTARAFKG